MRLLLQLREQRVDAGLSLGQPHSLLLDFRHALPHRRTAGGADAAFRLQLVHLRRGGKLRVGSYAKFRQYPPRFRVHQREIDAGAEHSIIHVEYNQFLFHQSNSSSVRL